MLKAVWTVNLNAPRSFRQDVRLFRLLHSFRTWIPSVFQAAVKLAVISAVTIRTARFDFISFGDDSVIVRTDKRLCQS